VADTDPRLFPALPNVGGSFSSDDRAWIMYVPDYEVGE
jgi:hypothetical protein